MITTGTSMAGRLLGATVLSATLLTAGMAQGEEYVIDTKDQHAFIQFKISHLGYSMLLGRFNDFSGSFNFDEENPGNSSVNVEIDTASVDSNHAERDKHLRSDDFLYVDEYPQASFVSKSIIMDGDGKATVKGDLTLRGVTKSIEIDANRIGGGKDPWGGYRQGFEGTTSFALKDFGIPKDLGPASENVEMYLSFEGIRK